MDGGEDMPSNWSRRTFLAASASTLAAATLQAASAADEKLLYVGSGAKGPGTGVHVGTWSAAAGTLSTLRLVAPADSAGWLVASNRAGKRVLFAGHQSAPKVGA